MRPRASSRSSGPGAGAAPGAMRAARGRFGFFRAMDRRSPFAARSGDARRQPPVDGAEPLEELLADAAVGIDERVGVLAARLVQQVGDIDPVRGETGGDLAYHVGHVAVGDAESRGVRYPRQHRLRIVDAVSYVAVLEKVTQLLGDHDGAVLLRLPGRGAEMRQGHHPGMLLEQTAREIAHV